MYHFSGRSSAGSTAMVLVMHYCGTAVLEVYAPKTFAPRPRPAPT